MTKSELIARLAMRFPQLVAKDADFTVRMAIVAVRGLHHGVWHDSAFALKRL
jgi:integration host factor subunit beta